MRLKRNIKIDNNSILQNLNRLTNQIYKLLPMYEEGENWQKQLDSILEEMVGMERLLIGQHDILFPLLCKLEGLFYLTERDNFDLYRNSIFKCLSLLEDLKKSCQD